MPKPTTRLEAFIIANKIHRGKLASATNYRIDYIRDVRLGIIVPRQEVMHAVAEACSKLTGRTVSLHEVFDVELMAGLARPLRCSLSAVYVRRNDGVAAYVPEIPGVEVNGASLEEAKRRLGEKLHGVLMENGDRLYRAISAADVLLREGVVSEQWPWR